MSESEKKPDFQAMDFIGSAKMVGSEDLIITETSRGGHVYLAHDGIYVKIGMTRNDPEARMDQLNSTGVVHDWELIHSVWALDAERLERYLHYILDDYRVRSDREFFDVEPEEAQVFLDFCHRFQTAESVNALHDCEMEVLGVEWGVPDTMTLYRLASQIHAPCPSDEVLCVIVDGMRQGPNRDKALAFFQEMYDYEMARQKELKKDRDLTLVSDQVKE